MDVIIVRTMGVSWTQVGEKTHEGGSIYPEKLKENEKEGKNAKMREGFRQRRLNGQTAISITGWTGRGAKPTQETERDYRGMLIRRNRGRIRKREEERRAYRPARSVDPS